MSVWGFNSGLHWAEKNYFRNALHDVVTFWLCGDLQKSDYSRDEPRCIALVWYLLW